MLFFLAGTADADDGYRLWLRYDSLPTRMISIYRPRVTAIVVTGNSARLNAIRGEFTNGLTGLLGSTCSGCERYQSRWSGGGGNTQEFTADRRSSIGRRNLLDLGPEGFRIRSVTLGGHSVTVIASDGELGALYGAFHFLRLMQTLQPINKLDVTQKPRVQLRMLDHWDNLDGSVERGYAGRSLWNWSALPDTVDPRLLDYARANASIGINGSLLNNVNANAQILTADYLRKVAAIADVFRPYGVRVFLSARFSAPMELGGLKTADPFDPEVAHVVEEEGG